MPKFHAPNQHSSDDQNGVSQPAFDAFDQGAGYYPTLVTSGAADGTSPAVPAATSGASGATGSVGGGSNGGGVTITSGVEVRTQGSGLVFVNNYDATCTAAYENCIVAAEKTLESLFTNSLTVEVTFSQQVTAPTLQTPRPNALVNTWPNSVKVSYATLTSALPASDSLPATDPNPNPNQNGGKDWSVPEAYARMLGLSSSTPPTDDTVTLNTWYNWSYGQDVINGVIHELSEGIMGRTGSLNPNGAWSTMDLFHYSSPGVPDYNNGRDSQPTFFSSDGVNLSSSAGLSFNNQFSGNKQVNTGDTSDWAQQAVMGATNTGETLTLTQTELDVMAALGWNVALPQDVFMANADDWQTPADWSNGSMPITPEDAFLGVFNAATVTSNANVTVNSIGTNTISTLAIANNSSFTATNGTVLNPAHTSSWGTGNDGAIDVDVGSTLEIGNAFDNFGSLSIGANPVNNGDQGSLVLDGKVTLNGGGTVHLGQVSGNTDGTGSITGGVGAGLINVDNTLSGGGSIILQSFDNQAGGTVEASQAQGFDLQVSAATFRNEGTMRVDSGAVLDLGQDGTNGWLSNTGAIDIGSNGDLAISGNFTVSGGGAINLKGAGSSITSDTQGPTTFYNESTINAFAPATIGDINDLTFDNAGGTVATTGAGNMLILDTGSNDIADYWGGTLLAENNAQMMIDSNVVTGAGPTYLKGHWYQQQGGTIEAASGGVVTANGTVSPGGWGPLFSPGDVLIAGGTFELAAGAADTTPIVFSGAGGTLQVDSVADTLAAISGAVAGDSIDARFMPFSNSVAALWQGNGTGGTLTLTNGSTSMAFTLSGNHSFGVSDDGHGGTLIKIHS